MKIPKADTADGPSPSAYCLLVGGVDVLGAGEAEGDKRRARDSGELAHREAQAKPDKMRSIAPRKDSCWKIPLCLPLRKEE